MIVFALTTLIIATGAALPIAAVVFVASALLIALAMSESP